VEQNNEPKPGLMLYGFDYPPSLDVKINWTEMYDANIPAKSQEACSTFVVFFFNFIVCCVLIWILDLEVSIFL